MGERRGTVEWPTLGLVLACYAGWSVSIFWISALWLPTGIVATMVCIALHSSLTHELLHGHPFRSRHANEALAFPSLGLFVPYRRFRDLHIAHHNDTTLTDPYDDPESNYLDPATWAALPRWVRRVLLCNNTLLGRILLGPAVGLAGFLRADWRALRAGDPAVRKAWLLHLPAAALVLALVIWAPMPLWAYLVAAYCGYGIIKIRTFLEHRAHESAGGRTAIVEDRGLLAFLFLNNNLHVVHHMHPKVAWYDLPALYRADRQAYRDRNDSYVYRSYGEIFRQHLLRAKDPVAHPLWRRP